MNQQASEYSPSVGAVYACVGIVLIVLGVMAATNVNENSAFGLVGAGLLAAGSYATIAGAVARGVQLARE